MVVVHYLAESPTSRTKTQPFVAKDELSMVVLNASTRPASGHLVNHARDGLTVVIVVASGMCSDVG